MTGIWSKERYLYDIIYYATRAFDDKNIQKRFTMDQVSDIWKDIKLMVRTEKLLQA